MAALIEPSFRAIIGWELFILCACFGWGYFVSSIFETPDYTLGGAFGLCALMFLSGIANLLQIFNPPFIISILGAGFLLFMWKVKKSLTENFKKTESDTNQIQYLKYFLIVLILLLALGQFSFYARSMEFSYVDDYQAYFVFPIKLLAKGHLGLESFSERRLIASLGGKYALDAMVLFGSGLKSLWGTDNSIGLGLLLAALWGVGRLLALSFPLLAIMLLWGMLIHPPAVNLTAVTLALPLILSMSALLSQTQESFTYKKILAVSFLMAGIVMLKTSLFPICVLIIGFNQIYRFKNSPRIKLQLKQIGVMVAAWLLFSLPWMIASFQDCGTFWYPLFGTGNSLANYNADYSIFPKARGLSGLYQAIKTILSPGIYSPLVFVFTTLFFLRVIFKKPITIYGIVPFAGMVTTIFILYQQPSPLGDRFAFAGAMATTLFGVLVVLSEAKMPANRSGILAVVTALIMIVAVGINLFQNQVANRLALYRGILRNPIQAAYNISKVAEGDLVPMSDVKRYGLAQNSIPKGSRVLDRTLKPFLWDYSRNSIFLADVPGTASPPPGMPMDKGPKALRDYLVSYGIHYLAYDYHSEAGLPFAQFSKFENDLTINPWLRSQCHYGLLAQKAFHELGTVYPRIFDDGQMEIIFL